ncbi:MAG TPA: DUF6600 domain-containing protein [Candidatus Acidoferrales bacterium]|nr:DUF6600 domain-containing protein [Candidatus Acidoferrales bacterium]
MRKAIRSASLLLLVGLFAALPAFAQSHDEDPPGRVARLNYMEGSVSYQVQGDTDWVAADPNRPLTTGDNLWADKDSRGEVHIDSNAIRLSSETGLSFLNLDDRTVQLQLPQGRIEIHLRQLNPGDAWEIDTPNLAFTLAREGEYVISTDPDGNSTTIVVREGGGQVTGGGDSWDLNSDQEYTFNGADQLSYDAQSAPDFDDFEAWCQSRDQRENNSASAQYVSRDVDGYYDLDEYGEWSEQPDYGPVWYPRDVAVDWVPYHVGHWVYIAPWGWTWVDEEPWGFAPFHYGRWVLIGARWGWVPGPRVVRPVYAPALVAFVGGPGFGLSVSFGGGFTGVAWFPLGPRDVFVPTYHCSPRYVQYVNVTNTRVVSVTQVTNVYNTVIVNRNYTRVNYTYADNHRAVTVVSRDTFVGARPVNREVVHINEDQFKNVRVSSHTEIAPTHTSYVGANARSVSTRPNVPFSQRPVVARLTPRAPREVHQAPAMNSRGAQNNAPSNNGFRNFGDRGNVNRGSQNNNRDQISGENNAPNNGRVQPPPTNNTMPVTNRGPRTLGQQGQQPNRGSNTGQNANMNNGQGAPNNGVEASPRPRTLEEQGTPNEGNNNNQSSGNGNFRPFTPPDRGNRGGATNNNGGNQNQPAPRNEGNNGAPQTQPNNNHERYRYSPPVRANDQNYDVHPPLNQDRPQSQPSRQQVQPREQHQSEQHQSAPKDNKQSTHDNNNRHQ